MEELSRLAKAEISVSFPVDISLSASTTAG